MDSIQYIYPPYVYTANGHRHELKDIKGVAKIGVLLDEDLTVIGNANDSDCVGGVCPIK